MSLVSFFPQCLSGRKKILLSIAFFICVFQTSAQRQGTMNLPKYDHQKIHFGFLLGMNFSDLKAALVSDFRISDSIYTVDCEPVVGLNLGILANLRLGEYFDLRFLPSLSFAQRNLTYNFSYNDTTSPATVVKNVESNYLEFPIDLKFKSKRLTNYRIYVLAGFKYSIDMISQASVDSKDNEIVKLRRYDYGYEIGLGFDFYMPFFKFSPEIKMYHGLNDLLVQDGRVYSNMLSGLFSKVFVLNFTFE